MWHWVVTKGSLYYRLSWNIYLSAYFGSDFLHPFHPPSAIATWRYLHCFPDTAHTPPVPASPTPSLPGSTVCLTVVAWPFAVSRAKTTRGPSMRRRCHPIPAWGHLCVCWHRTAGWGEGSIRETAVAMATEVRTAETGEGVGCGEGRVGRRVG